MKINHRFAWGIACAGLLLNLAIGYRVYSNDAATEDESKALEKLTIMMQVMHLIRQDYVTKDQTEASELLDSAIHGMVSNLDAHSSYLEPVDYEDMVETTEGRFGGIGIIVTVRDDLLTVVSPIEDTPGSRAGLQAGDQIVRINDESTQDMRIQDAVHQMKGDPGTEVELTIYRPSEEREIQFTITRDVIEVASVKDSRLLTESIGYTRVTQFNETAASELGEALRELQEKGVQSLVLDLRNNPGGLLNGAVDMCGYFLPPKTLVVSTEGRRPSQKQKYRTTAKDVRFDGPVAILINKGSASAAEIVAGCLKDHERAMLVGEQTFGKGSVQNVIPLPDGSALRLTTAMYYTPQRQIIHDVGITPDIVVEMQMKDWKALQDAQQDAMTSGENPDYTLDPQIKRAVETLKSYSRYQTTL